MSSIGTAFLASSFSNIMNYLQTLFSFFNVPMFVVFIVGMFWKRMTARGRLLVAARRAPWRR